MILRTILLSLAAILCLHRPAAAENPALETFDLAGGKAHLQAPAKPAAGRPWIWYAPTVNGNFILLSHRFYADAFLNAGIALASCDLGEVRGAPASTARFSRLHEAMVQRGYSAKPVLLGQSRGGLMTLAWAVRHPDKVAAWAGIYPVCNLASYPLTHSKRETLADFGMDEATLRARLGEFNPIDHLTGLANLKVPLFSVHGDQDRVVPHDENTRLLQERYAAAGGTCEVKLIPGGGHEGTPAFFECRELVAFVLKHAGP